MAIARAVATLAVLGFAAHAAPAARAEADIGTEATKLAQTACPAPYRVRAADGRCVWSCAAGTRPDPASGACVCQEGHRPAPQRAQGRLVCVKDGASAPAAPGSAVKPPQTIVVPPAIGTPPQSIVVPPPTARRATAIASPAQWSRRRGANMNLFSVLLDQRGAPMADETVIVEVSARGRDRPMHACRVRTDAHGRAACLVPIPLALDDYDVRLRFDGSPLLAPSSAQSRILGENVPTFDVALEGGDGVRLETHAIIGGFGVPTPLRAVVTRRGRPLANELVEIAADGVALGSVRTDEAGIAKLHWTPTVAALRNFLPTENAETRQPVGYVGALEFWHLPAAQTPAAPAVATAKADFRLTDPGNLCRRVGGRGGEREGYPHRCSTGVTTQSRLTILRDAGATVRRNAFGRAEALVDGHFRIELPQPPDPPPNPDCDARVVNVADACRSSCSRLEYLTFGSLGEIAALLGPPGGGNARCGWALAHSVAPDPLAINEAHDACAQAAARRGMAQWNHSVTTVMTVRVAAVFGFIDAHTRGVPGNWEYKQFLQHKVLSTTFELPVRVECR